MHWISFSCWALYRHTVSDGVASTVLVDSSVRLIHSEARTRHRLKCGEGSVKSIAQVYHAQMLFVSMRAFLPLCGCARSLCVIPQ